MACKTNFTAYDKAKSAYLFKVLDNTRGSTQEFFKIMKRSSGALPTTMFYENIPYSGEALTLKMSEILSSSFLENVPSFGISNEEIDGNILSLYEEHFSDQHSNIWDNFSLTTDIAEVKKFILELKDKKDPGPMQIPANFLRFNVDAVAPIIMDSINTIFRTGRIPQKWKQCYILPIPKKGAINDLSNYRGIAIQSCVPKILDRIITRMLYENLGPLIKKSQHGFMKGRSTTTNLIEIAQLIHENKNQQVDVVYFDFSKAFDQVRHDLLAIKLSKYAIPFNFFKVIMKFMIGREYLLKIDGSPTNISFRPASSLKDPTLDLCALSFSQMIWRYQTSLAMQMTQKCIVKF